ncbi:hypothetical protein SmJEL517_g00184 [Synchytrium microbalum]|uniref:Xylanolytic transcriptional activator regulatory domain-containing protein n=1 Tax=Synchytrium microbalum TaxID=1806994 RepID=A0A507C9A8_9FUNG|nr:uncharacterized protein SmJEL517_g00184 [Synchytrium microbalum]TPX38170.1 hypothetical protein SmJEL517_g00184 [Synchytrium microbalum]
MVHGHAHVRELSINVYLLYPLLSGRREYNASHVRMRSTSSKQGCLAFGEVCEYSGRKPGSGIGRGAKASASASPTSPRHETPTPSPALSASPTTTPSPVRRNSSQSYIPFHQHQHSSDKQWFILKDEPIPPEYPYKRDPSPDAVGRSALGIADLIDLFFTHVHPDVPYNILHSVDFCEPWKPHAPLLLDAMCALAKVRSSQPPPPGHPSWRSGDEYFMRAQATLSQALEVNLTYETVQGLLLLCMYASISDRLNLVSEYLAMAVRLAQLLGLDKELPIPDIGDQRFLVAEAKRRTWYGVVLLDLYLSFVLFPGRTPQIPDHVKTTLEPPAPEFIWGYAHGVNPTFISDQSWRPAEALLRLGCVAHRITHHFYHLFGLSRAPNVPLQYPEFSPMPYPPNAASIPTNTGNTNNTQQLPSFAIFHQVTPPNTAASVAPSNEQTPYFFELEGLDRGLLQWYWDLPQWVRDSEKRQGSFSSSLESCDPPTVLAPCLLITFHGLRCGLHAPAVAKAVQTRESTSSVVPTVSSLKAAVNILGILLAERPGYSDGASIVTQFALYLLGLSAVIIRRLAPDLIQDCPAETMALRALDSMTPTVHSAAHWSDMLRDLMLRFQAAGGGNRQFVGGNGSVAAATLPLPMPPSSSIPGSSLPPLQQRFEPFK